LTTLVCFALCCVEAR